MNRSKQFVDFKKKSQLISKCSLFDMMVEFFAELKVGEEFKSAKIKFLDGDDEWWISITKRNPERYDKSNTKLTFQLDASEYLWKSSKWNFFVSGTINGKQFKTYKLRIYQKKMVTEEHLIIAEENEPVKLSLKMKISEDDTDCMAPKQKFIDATRQYKQIISNNKIILINGTYSDFTFIVRGQLFKVHKSILAAASPVFDKLFQSKFSETIISECRVAEIEPVIFQMLLDFIYGGELPQQLHEEKLTRKLFEAAHYYQINGLVDICTSVEHYKLTKLNAVDMYEWADTYGLENIKIDAWKIIRFDILEIFEEKQPPPLDIIRSLIAAKQEKEKLMEDYRCKMRKLDADTKDLLK